MSDQENELREKGVAILRKAVDDLAEIGCGLDISTIIKPGINPQVHLQVILLPKKESLNEKANEEANGEVGQ